MSNIFVVRKEVNSEYLLKGIKTVEANIRGMVARKKLAQSRAEKALTMIKGLLDYSEFKLELCGGNSDNVGFFSAEKPRLLPIGEFKSCRSSLQVCCCTKLCYFRLCKYMGCRSSLSNFQCHGVKFWIDS